MKSMVRDADFSCLRTQTQNESQGRFSLYLSMLIILNSAETTSRGRTSEVLGNPSFAASPPSSWGARDMSPVGRNSPSPPLAELGTASLLSPRKREPSNSVGRAWFGSAVAGRPVAHD